MYKKLLFNNLSIVWNITIHLITFRRLHSCCVQSFVEMSEIAWDEFEKVCLRHFANLREKNGRRKWAWPISRDSAQFSEFLNVQ